MGSEEGEDGGEGSYRVRGGFRFLGGEVDVAAVVVGDKNVLVSATRFHGQLTGEVREKPRETVRMKGGQSKEVRGQGSPRGKGWKNEGTRGRGKVGVVGFGRSGGFFELRLGGQGR